MIPTGGIKLQLNAQRNATNKFMKGDLLTGLGHAWCPPSQLTKKETFLCMDHEFVTREARDYTIRETNCS
jgi:hypothetical protein